LVAASIDLLLKTPALLFALSSSYKVGSWLIVNFCCLEIERPAFVVNYACVSQHVERQASFVLIESASRAGVV